MVAFMGTDKPKTRSMHERNNTLGISIKHEIINKLSKSALNLSIRIYLMDRGNQHFQQIVLVVGKTRIGLEGLRKH
jgi:hypothetical protein